MLLLATAAALAAPDDTPIATPTAPPQGFHVGIGAGIGTSYGTSAYAYTFSTLSTAATSTAGIWITGSVRVRTDGGFTLEPSVSCVTGAGAVKENDPGSDTTTTGTGEDTEEDPWRDRYADCQVGLSFRPRLGARGGLELHGVVGIAYSGTSFAFFEPEDEEDPSTRTFDHALMADAGIALQKWFGSDLALSLDLHAVTARARYAGHEDVDGEVTEADTSWSVALDPGARLMIHLYW